MKHSGRHISKKNKPKDLKRVTLADGTRVWRANGTYYPTLRSVPDVKEIPDTKK